MKRVMLRSSHDQFSYRVYRSESETFSELAEYLAMFGQTTISSCAAWHVSSSPCMSRGCQASLCITDCFERGCIVQTKTQLDRWHCFACYCKSGIFSAASRLA